MNPFIPTMIYQILTVNDELFGGIVRGVTEDEVTMFLTVDSENFSANDVVTIGLPGIIAFNELPQD